MDPSIPWLAAKLLNITALMFSSFALTRADKTRKPLLWPPGCPHAGIADRPINASYQAGRATSKSVAISESPIENPADKSARSSLCGVDASITGDTIPVMTTGFGPRCAVGAALGVPLFELHGGPLLRTRQLDLLC